MYNWAKITKEWIQWIGLLKVLKERPAAQSLMRVQYAWDATSKTNMPSNGAHCPESYHIIRSYSLHVA